MIEEPKVVIFTTGYIEPYVDEDEVCNRISDMFDTERWVQVSTHINDIPTEFLTGSVEDFYDGIAFSQYHEMEKGNIYVNPMLIGLMYNSEVWVDFLSKKNDIVAYFLEISYQDYLMFGDSRIVDEERFESQNKALKAIVKSINNLNQSKKGIH